MPKIQNIIVYSTITIVVLIIVIFIIWFAIKLSSGKSESYTLQSKDLSPQEVIKFLGSRDDSDCPPTADCSRPCGVGLQYQSVGCKDSNGNPVSLEFCSQLADHPQYVSKDGMTGYRVRPCNTDPCNYTTGDWGDCVDGTQTRTVTCDNPGCCNPDNAPSSTQDCPAYTWCTDDYGSCSTDCGDGTQTRDVTCCYANSGSNDSGSWTEGDPYSGTGCPGAGTEPSTTQDCQGYSGCQYDYGDWQPFPK